MDLLSDDFFNFPLSDLLPSPPPIGWHIENREILRPPPLSPEAQDSIEAGRAEWEVREEAEA